MSIRQNFAAALFTLAFVAPASAATILSSDFDGRTVSGNSASNISWTTTGVADPGNLTVVGEDFNGNALPATFFNTPNAQNRLAVDMNVENEGPWFIDISLQTLADDIALTSLTLDGLSFNNSGSVQGVGRELDISLSIVRNSDSAVLFSGEDDNGDVITFSSNFDLSAVSLAANTGYTLTIGGNSDRRNRGNNGGIDNFVLTGDLIAPVPLPAGLPLLLSGVLAIGLIRRKRV